MRKAAPLVVLLLTAACSKPQAYVAFSDPSGFSADVPSGWTRSGDADFSRRPVAVLTWIGVMTAQDEGIPIGAVINVTRVSRKREDLKDERSWQRYKADWLDRSESLFAKTMGDSAAFTQKFTMENKLHGLKPTAIQLEDVVLRTPDAYWVLDYRATTALYDKHRPAFERLKKTAKPGQ